MRQVSLFLLMFFSAAQLSFADPYQPTHDSLSRHQVPAWFQDGKFGIMIHYGLYSVPGWAPLFDPTKGKFTSTFFLNNPYSEWYFNTMQIQNSPTSQYHQKTYPGRTYESFQTEFNQALQKWDPNQWASIFEKAGAKYVVFVTKHHDGFLLWPSAYPNPYKEHYGVTRDVVGELTQAVRNHHMKMGLYYSGGYDWSWLESGVDPKPITNIISAMSKVPQTPAYALYVTRHYHELIERYHPDLLWNDIALPRLVDKWKLFADYYNAVPEAIVNNRWGQGQLDYSLFGQPTDDQLNHQLSYDWFDYYSPEYLPRYVLTQHKWEADHGPGYSFAYNRQEYIDPKHLKSTDELIADLADLVSKNGNLLLAIGPEADGTIPMPEYMLLAEMGKWLKNNGEAIYATKAWKKQEGFANHAVIPLRFTMSKDEKSLYVILLKNPNNSDIVIDDLPILDSHTKIEVLNGDQPIEILGWKVRSNNLFLPLSSYKKIPSQHPISLKITPIPNTLD